MRLTEAEYYEFLDIHQSMIVYAGKKVNVLGAEISAETSRILPTEERFEARNALYEIPGIITEYVKKNPDGLGEEALDIAAGFQQYLSGKFIIIKYLKKHTIFLSDEVAYGVLSLSDLLEDMFAGECPVLVNAVLLPYRGKIVYDGLLTSYPIHYGRSYRTSINQSYQEAKANYGIVTQLPFQKPTQTKDGPEKKLALYMKNAKNRDYYFYEIEDLLKEHPELIGKYHWHWGKIHSRKKKKWLKELGLHNLHYAIVNDTIIAQGESAQQVKQMVKAMLPRDKQEWAFFFQVK